MKKNIKRALLIIVAVVIICSVFTACNGKKTDTNNTTTEETSTNIVTSIDMEELINSEADGKPIVEIRGDQDTLFSFDFSENATSEVEVTIDKKLKDDYLYITMAGNVTAHTLESDGSLFDGIADIENGKAQFSVTYNNERTINFIINVSA